MSIRMTEGGQLAEIKEVEVDADSIEVSLLIDTLLYLLYDSAS